MRTLHAIGVLAVIAALVATEATSAAPRHPTLRIAKLQPLTVEGRRFLPRERVRVQVSDPKLATRRVIAGKTGSFTVRFADIGATRCDLIRVIAIRTGNRSVEMKQLPSPACMPG
jgi:hypothetical protein